MSETICSACPISETCTIKGNPFGLPVLVDYNDCWGWSCPQVGKPAAQRVLRGHFKSKIKVPVKTNQSELIRFGSIQKPTAYAFSLIQRAVDKSGDIYTCRLGGTLQKNGQNAYDLRGK